MVEDIKGTVSEKEWREEEIENSWKDEHGYIHNVKIKEKEY